MPTSLPPAFDTVYSAFKAIAVASPEAACIAVPPRPGRAYDPAGFQATYGEVLKSVNTLQLEYVLKGYGHGHRVAISLENRPTFMYHWLALNGLGASVVPINPDYKTDDLRYLLSHSEPDLVIALPERISMIRGVAKDMPGVQATDADVSGGALPCARRPALPSAPGQDTEGAILYTSGTTGMPKACRLCNDYFFFSGERYLSAGGAMHIEPGRERLYNPLPLFYANAFGISNMAMILSGGCMIFPDRFHPQSFWDDIESTKATIIHYLGLIPAALLAMPVRNNERSHRLKFGCGAGVDPAQHEAFERRFGFPLVEVWGMSELAVVIAENHEPRRMEGRSIGRPLRDLEVAIVDESGRGLPDGEAGELVVRRNADSPRDGFFSGYFKDEAETERSWRGGWFHTGDIARREKDGRYIFVDRIKHMIRRSGQNIAAAEIETVLIKHPAVQQVAVIAAPDALREEEVLACIVLKKGETESLDTAKAFVEYCLERIAYFKAPGWVAFFETLPTTSTHKLQKGQILGPGRTANDLPKCFDLRHLKSRS
jgi:acyl-CoA synthetase (AMP-forming)/AMP-acid ligase II